MYYPQQPVTTTMTAVTVEKAISAIKTAAEEIPADEFISYSTILDVHLSYALEIFSRDNQLALLQALEEVLNDNEDLTRNIAWDLIIVLLPFLDGPPPPTTAAPTASTTGILFPSQTPPADHLIEIASKCLRLAVEKGNPREVFLKILSALSSLSFAPSSASGPPPDVEDGYEYQPPPSPATPQKTPSEARVNGFRKFSLLLELLDTVHTKISTTFPSRFLSQSLTTVLRTFTRSVESLNRVEVDEVATRILQFVDSVQPPHTKRRRVGSEPKLGPSGRPLLPPRTSTISSIQNGEEAKEEGEQEKQERLEKEERARMEEELQIRLLQSFLTHVVEVYILRCPTEFSTTLKPQVEQHLHPDTAMGAGEEDSSLTLPPKRGIQFHFASRYMKSKNLDGGVIQAEIQATSSHIALLKQIMELSFQLGINSTELLELCTARGVGIDAEIGDDPKSPSAIGPAPRFVEDIPLSKTGSLIILAANIFDKDAPQLADIRLFPEHKEITEKFLSHANTEFDIGVIDSVLFLGAWILGEAGGFGDVDHGAEQPSLAAADPGAGGDPWLLYLQTYAVLSATAASPLLRLLAHTHLSSTIHAHPDEAVRLEYIKDTLEHCPFEQLQAAMVGILKNEIAKATTSDSSTTSIFSTPLVLEELSMFLFPDLSSGVLEHESGWEWFEENYGTVMATANLWLFLLMRSGNEGKNICGIREYDGRIEERWAGALRSWLESCDKGELQKRALETQVEMVQLVMERIKKEQEKSV